MRTTVERLARMVARADEETLVAGVEWYPRYHDFAVHIGRALGVPTRTAAAIIAVLSPGVEAEVENIKLALAIGNQGWDITQLEPELNRVPRRAIIKALRLRDGEDPDDVFDPRRAPKTTCFYHNIWMPVDDSWVTIDGRMVDIIHNRMQPWKQKRGIESARLRSGKRTRYEEYEHVLRCVGRREAIHGLRMNGVSTQAVLWMIGKQIETAGVTVNGTPRKQGPHRKGQAYIGRR